jgi:phosphotransacetylase
MYPITIGGRSWLDINLVNKSGIIWNETADTPYSTRITYYLVPNISSGSITYKLYQ